MRDTCWVEPQSCSQSSSKLNKLHWLWSVLGTWYKWHCVSLLLTNTQFQVTKHWNIFFLQCLFPFQIHRRELTSCRCCCWEREPSGESREKLLRHTHCCFILCACVCVCERLCRSSGSGCFLKNVLTGGEWEKSRRTVSVEVQNILFSHPPTLMDTNLVFPRMCMKMYVYVSVQYLLEVYHEGAEAHRHRLSALHAGEDPVH